jgi:hypothetical protein
LYAAAIERTNPMVARQLREFAIGYGTLAWVLSDAPPMGSISNARHRTMQSDALELAAAATTINTVDQPSRRFIAATRRLFNDCFPELKTFMTDDERRATEVTD